MPFYDYRCNSCSEVTEVRHSIKDDRPQICPNCGEEMERLVNCRGGFVLYGDGFTKKAYKNTKIGRMGR